MPPNRFTPSSSLLPCSCTNAGERHAWRQCRATGSQFPFVPPTCGGYKRRGGQTFLYHSVITGSRTRKTTHTKINHEESNWGKSQIQQISLTHNSHLYWKKPTILYSTQAVITFKMCLVKSTLLLISTHNRSLCFASSASPPAR